MSGKLDTAFDIQLANAPWAVDAATWSHTPLSAIQGSISTDVCTQSTVDLAGYVLLPGLINAHDHLELPSFPTSVARRINHLSAMQRSGLPKSTSSMPEPSLNTFRCHSTLGSGGGQSAISSQVSPPSAITTESIRLSLHLDFPSASSANLDGLTPSHSIVI